jgi:hypothetical protein
MSGAEQEEEEEIAPPKYCTPELIKEHLCQIGKTMDGNSFAFLRLDLKDQEVINLSDEVGSYQNL